MTTDPQTNVLTAPEVEVKRYVVVCPSCRDWLECDYSRIGSTVEHDICGATFKVTL